MRAVRPRDVIRIKWRGRYAAPEDRYYARCEPCDWKCHTTPHKTEDVAQRCMDRHVVSKHPPKERT